MSKKGYILSVLLLESMSFAAQFKGSDRIISYLNTNLAFREAYIPTIQGVLYVYIFPLVLGFLIGKIFPKKNFLFFVNVSLFFGIIHSLFFIYHGAYLVANQYWFNNTAFIFEIILFPILFFLGTIPFALFPNNYVVDDKNIHTITWDDIKIACGLAVLLFCFNFIPFFYSKYPVGADVYYHEALTQQIIHSFDIRKNAFFLEDKNYYYSFIYFILGFLENLTKTTTQFVWNIYVGFSSAIFIFFFYLFAKKNTGSSGTGIIASVFILPLNQILWPDPSLRIGSYALFVVFIFVFSLLLNKKKIFLFFGSTPLLFITLGSHPEVGLHALAITTLFFILYKLSFAKKITNKISATLKKNITYDQPSSHEYKIFLILMSLFVLLLEIKINFLLTNFSILQTFIFNEIAFSALQPVGVISFIVFLLAPVGIYYALINPTINNLFLISIASLYISVIFYFSLIWQLYHRYFAETAYIALSILAASVIFQIYQKVQIKKRIAFSFVIMGFFLLSIAPKYLFISTYAQSINQRIDAIIPDMQFVNKNTKPNSVVMINPDDIINRYLPLFADRYIFSGSGAISKEHQWQVLAFCNGPFSKACDKRLAFADTFFHSPSSSTLQKIKQEYQIDYLLLNKSNPDEIAKFTGSDLHLSSRMIGQTDNYILYNLKEKTL